jgi:putative flippase GtrA
MKSFMLFAVVGAVVLATENIIVFILSQMDIDYYYVRLLSALICLLLSYLLNTTITFKARITATKFLLFVSGAGFGAAASYLISLVFYYLVFESQHPLVATNLGAVVALGVNYCYQRFVTFRQQPKTEA